MTVRINKPALNLREELTKAQGVVRYEQRQFWMDGFVENGTFDTDTSGWLLYGDGATTFTHSSGRVLITAATGGDGIYQGISTVIGKTYFVTASYEVGTASEVLITSNASGSGSATGTTSGSLSYLFTASGTTTFIRFVTGSTSTGTAYFDNIKLFEVDENDNVIHSVPLGFKPVHVYEDGLLQREGDNHDYTVVNTGFGYQVKPTVAPSATTETCIIAEREL